MNFKIFSEILLSLVAVSSSLFSHLSSVDLKDKAIETKLIQETDPALKIINNPSGQIDGAKVNNLKNKDTQKGGFYKEMVSAGLIDNVQLPRNNLRKQDIVPATEEMSEKRKGTVYAPQKLNISIENYNHTTEGVSAISVPEAPEVQSQSLKAVFTEPVAEDMAPPEFVVSSFVQGFSPEQTQNLLDRNLIVNHKAYNLQNLLTGHSSTVFKPLHYLNVNDTVKIKGQNYRVSEVIHFTGSGVENRLMMENYEGDFEWMLQTCLYDHPTNRLIVKLRL